MIGLAGPRGDEAKQIPAEYALDMDQVRVSPAALISTIPVRHPLWSADDGPGRPEVCLIGPVLLGLTAVAIAGGTAGGEHGDDQASKVPFRGLTAPARCPSADVCGMGARGGC